MVFAPLIPRWQLKLSVEMSFILESKSLQSICS